jgi:predicted O-methyltransferase YrrM
MASLKHLVGQPAVMLEIGSFEGRSTCWFLENILTHDDARIICIDPWDLEENSYSIQFDMASVRENFIANTEKFSHKMVAIRDYSMKVLCSLVAGIYADAPVAFNAIYIDGNHSTLPVLQDTLLCWELLAPGGILIFDDYDSGNQDTPIKDIPKIAIDSFLATVHGRYRTIHSRYQLIIQKIQ